MKFISICSGIEAASVAFNGIGWEAVAFSEIEPFPCSLLAHHYPDIPNFGDMTKFREWPEEVFVQADMIVGGPPCQSFSVAGKREGLNDDRGNLTLIYTELIDHADTIRLKHGKPPVTILYENVPGLLSSKDNAFGCFLAALAGEDCELKPSGKRWSNAGYVLGSKRAIAWRVLDAQYFGLAQRRKRVFVVASAREGFCPAKVLFEFDGVRRDIAPSREAGENTTTDAGRSVNAAGSYGELVGTLCARDYKGVGNQYVSEGKLIVENPNSHLGSEDASFGDKLGLENQHIDGGGAPLFVPAKAFGIPGNCLNPDQPQCWRVYDPRGLAPTLQSGEARGNIVAFNSRQDPVSGDVFGALDTGSPQAQAIAIQGTVIGRKPENGPRGPGFDETGVCFTQTAVDRHAVATPFSVRRLTPIECERLQGFPDNYTQIPWRNKPANECPDGHRYKSLGNSWAVPVVKWIGSRIQDNVTQIETFKAPS